MNKTTALEDILDLTRKIAQNELAPRAKSIDEKGIWPEESLRKLQKAGLADLVIPAEFGGKGFGLEAVVKVCEILGRECASTAMCFGMHLVGSAVISAKATTNQKNKYLSKIIDGEHLTTIALSEPGTGANFYIPQAELKKQKNDDFILNGIKSFVTNGSHADSYVVTAVIPGPDRSIGQFSCVLIPKQAEGLEWQKQWMGMGMKGNSSRNVKLKNVRVPTNDLLGEAGDEIWYVFEVIAPFFIAAMSGTYLGIASAAIDEAIMHLKKRTHSHNASALAKQQLIQYKLGELWAQVERTRQLIYSAAVKGDSGQANNEVLLSLLSSKADVAECVVDVANKVMTLMGGIAYGEKGNVDRYLRDARAAHIMAPTTDLSRIWTGRALLGLPLLGD